MKSFLFSVPVFLLCFTVQAQKFCLKQSDNNDRSVKLLKKPAVDDPSHTSDFQPADYKPVSKSTPTTGVSETTIGSTVYDTQSNSAIGNRIFAYPDGTIAAVWTMGFTTANYPDRGTGYNYFDGTSWGDEPTARIEPVRTGWPSYYPLGNGELIVAHDFVSGLQISKRPEKGTGAWTTSLLAAPAGATKVSWPRVITVGNTIHIIAISGVPYQGLDLALLYYRSTDGGVTWENPVILPGLDAVSLGAGSGKSFSGFGSDSYAWAAPKGDTIAFAVASGMGGAWIMKSFDNGVSWSKITIFTMPVLTEAPSPIMASTDGAISVAMDSEGIAHVVFGRMFVSDDDYAAAGSSYYPYTDGLVYWNETMPQLDTTQLADAEMLMAQGNLIAWMVDYNGNAEIDFPEVASGKFPFGLYGSSLSSMGQIIIDETDKMYVTFSSCREDLVNAGAYPNVQLYRHLYLTEKMKELQWSEPQDLNDDIIHSYDECVFGSFATNTHAQIFSNYNILYHIDAEPGTSIGADADPPGDNYVNYLTIPTFGPAVKPADMTKDVLISPNPATDYADIKVLLNTSAQVDTKVYDAMGKLVLNCSFGEQAEGHHSFRLNLQPLGSGIFLLAVRIGNYQTTRKLIVE